MAKKKVIIKCELAYEFESYGSKAKDDRAARYIKRWVRDSLGSETHTPLYIDRDEGGAAIEDCSKRTRLSVKLMGKK